MSRNYGYDRSEKDENDDDDEGPGIRRVFIGITIACLILFVAVGQNYAVNVGSKYEKAVGGHVRNAYEVNTPEAMLAELNATEAGMIALGLTPDMYDVFWSWEQFPDHSMAFQYQFIDQLKNRTTDVIIWRNSAEQSNTSAQYTDVYNQKMDNLRKFMKEDCPNSSEPCTDWIARGAFILNKAPLYYWSSFLYIGLMIVGFWAFFSWMAMRLDDLTTWQELKETVAGDYSWRRSPWAKGWKAVPAVGLILVVLPFVIVAL